MKTALKLLLALVLLLVAVLGGTVGFFLATEHDPAPVEPVEVACQGRADGLVAGQPFTVLSWNLQYGASRRHRFFYDGGEAVHVPAEDVAWTVAAIQRVIREVDPDLALLQEVDRDSTRTGRIDQLPAYVEAARATCTAATPYHKSPFVPTPSHQLLGRVDMELANLARGPMLHASRLALPLLAEPRYRRVFNLKRAVLVTEVPVQGWEHPLAIANTHLSAFSFGDGTMQKQVALLREWIAARPEGQPWILAGDFNLLPPGFDKARLQVERDLYADQDNPIDALLPSQKEALGDQLDPAHRTYLPFGTTEPDRKIDYLFYGGPLRVEEARVLSQHNDISDHLPITARLVIQAPAPAPAEAAPTSAQELLERAEKAADSALKALE
jgi:endonuclease/exonuclease/phosphatase family metal-dependent hydrolase